MRAGPRHKARRWVYVGTGIVLVIVFCGPIAWSIIRSFEPYGVVTSVPALSDFGKLGLTNYSQLLGPLDILQYVFNSAIVVLGTVALTSVVGVLAGYGFSRFQFPGKNILFVLLLGTIMIPSQAIITPLFVEASEIHLTNSRIGLIIIYTTFNLPFALFVFRNSFAAIPRELDESGRLDGAGTFGLLWWVFRALLMPGFATVAIFTGLAAWTEFFIALIFLTSQSLYTVPVALLYIETGVVVNQVNFGLLDAGAVVAMIPALAFFLVLQRYYVRGLISGAVLG